MSDLGVLLIGGAGFLGRNIAQALVSNPRRPVRVIVLDCVPVPAELSRPNISYYRGSVSDPALIGEIMERERISTVVHLVSTLLPSSDSNAFLSDVSLVQDSAIRIMEACVRHSARFVYLSSGGTIYGAQHGVLSESCLTEPISFYGLSKLQIESLILFYHRRFGMEYLILRPSNPYGFGQRLDGKQGLIAVILGNIKAGTPTRIYGDGSSIRDYVYIDDFSRYVVELLCRETDNETINIGSGVGHSVNQVIETVERTLGIEIAREYHEGRKDDVREIVLDISRLKRLISLDGTDLETGIRKFCEKIGLMPNENPL